MEWTSDAFLQHLHEQTAASRKQKLSKLSPEELDRHTLAALKQALGAMPQQPWPLQPQVLEHKEYPDFYMERVSYTTMEHVNVPVLVLIPKLGDGPWPAVLACHGHGNGQLDAVGLDADGNELSEPGIHQRFAVQLVRKGMLVVIPEVMGFGARRNAEDIQDNRNSTSCATLSAHLLMHGRTLAGMRVYETIRALDYIQSRSDANPDSIGLYGFSGGSLIGAYAAVLDERIKAIVLSCWMNTFAESILSIRHCIDNYLPSILLDAEQPDLVRLIAPRPLFIEAGEHDHIFPVQAARQSVKMLAESYAACGASEQLDYDIHPGKHEISGRSAVPWLYSKLVGM